MCRFAAMSPRSIRFASVHLLVGGEQIHAADRAQIEPQRIKARLDGEIELLLPAFPLDDPSPLLSLYAVTPSAAITSTPCSTRWLCSSDTCSFVTSTSSSVEAISSNVR